MSDLLTDVIQWWNFESLTCVPIVVNYINASLLIEIVCYGELTGRPTSSTIDYGSNSITNLVGVSQNVTCYRDCLDLALP